MCTYCNFLYDLPYTSIANIFSLKNVWNERHCCADRRLIVSQSPRHMSHRLLNKFMWKLIKKNHKTTMENISLRSTNVASCQSRACHPICCDHHAARSLFYYHAWANTSTLSYLFMWIVFLHLFPSPRTYVFLPLCSSFVRANTHIHGISSCALCWIEGNLCHYEYDAVNFASNIDKMLEPVSMVAGTDKDDCWDPVRAHIHKHRLFCWDHWRQFLELALCFTAID